MKLSKIINELELFAPYRLSETDWDNSGLQIGNVEDEIRGILLCLDVNDEIVSYAMDYNLNLILSHHPLIFKGVKSIHYNDYKGKLLIDLIQNKINVFSMHTNLDAATFGVNYALSKLLGFENYSILHITETEENTPNPVTYGYGAVGELPNSIHLNELAKHLASQLQTTSLRYCGQPSKEVKKIAICGGSGSSFIKDAVASGVDVYITGDIGHHDAQEALEQGLAIIDAGHFDTEKHILPHLKKYLEEKINTELPIHIFDTNKFAFRQPF